MKLLNRIQPSIDFPNTPAVYSLVYVLSHTPAESLVPTELTSLNLIAINLPLLFKWVFVSKLELPPNVRTGTLQCQVTLVHLAHSSSFYLVPLAELVT